ncbi:hypothetical protein GVAMD_0780 [Gardnerella vaginalis AMD]|nr:hypothetical protein GVAMD_0780 [Gardnerella vaginalis AMD]
MCFQRKRGLPSSLLTEADFGWCGFVLGFVFVCLDFDRA